MSSGSGFGGLPGGAPPRSTREERYGGAATAGAEDIYVSSSSAPSSSASGAVGKSALASRYGSGDVASRETASYYAASASGGSAGGRDGVSASGKTSSYAATPRGLFGLMNLGNTCFMNSCLQCVSNLPPLTDLFLSRDLHVNRNATITRTRGEVALAWADLMHRMWGSSRATKGGVETPSQLKKVVGLVASRFLGYDQQDSQEFLVFLLDALMDDTNRLTAKPVYKELSERPEQSDGEVSRDWWRYYTERLDSPVRELVTGQLKTTVRCDTCGHVSRAFDPFNNLSLPIPKSAQTADRYAGEDGYGSSGGCSLSDCLRAFTLPEVLSGSEAVYCSRCKAHRTCTKSMTLFRLPPVLILQLKRFTFSTFRRTKLSTTVRFPVEGLDMRSFLADKAPDATPGRTCTTYDCVAVSNHSGSLGGGHYTADALNRDDGNWYHYNDGHVTRTSASRLSGSAAYLLFFVRSDLL